MKYEEYRGCENLVYAKITEDSTENLTYGDVKEVAGLGEVSKTTNTSSETHFYDNNPGLAIMGTGEDDLTLSTSAIADETIADMTGLVYDKATGMLIEGEREETYVAIGYITEKTSGEKIYVWRYKCMVELPDVNSKTKDNSADAQGQSLKIKSISTTHKFPKNKNRGCRGISVSGNKADVSTFFNQVTLPDDVTAKAA
ncbi:MAG: major tail protein [Roseburia sp.]|nr:major tail protein [Roseburia sp.]